MPCARGSPDIALTPARRCPPLAGAAPLPRPAPTGWAPEEGAACSRLPASPSGASDADRPDTGRRLLPSVACAGLRPLRVSHTAVPERFRGEEASTICRNSTHGVAADHVRRSGAARPSKGEDHGRDEVDLTKQLPQLYAAGREPTLLPTPQGPRSRVLGAHALARDGAPPGAEVPRSRSTVPCGAGP